VLSNRSSSSPTPQTFEIMYLNRSTSFICKVSFGDKPSGFFLRNASSGLQSQSRTCATVELLPITSGQEHFGMAFPPFMMKQLYHCDLVITACGNRV